jgi:hypothetical protein
MPSGSPNGGTNAALGTLRGLSDVDLEKANQCGLRAARAMAIAAAIWIGTVMVLSAGSGVGTARAAVTQPNSADRLIMWTGCTDLVAMSDAELDSWKNRGVDGFACGVQWLRGMGGTQDFTGDPSASLAGGNYELQRSLRDSRIGERMRARGMKGYLGVYLVNYFNDATPLKGWFDDTGWSGHVLPKLGDLAGAAKQLDLAGLAFDQELYSQEGGAQTATWNWNYPGNTHSEQEVRAKAKQRGRQLMTRLLREQPGIELLAYDVEFPQSWGELVQQKVNGAANVYAPRLDIDFWDGLSSVTGYGALRLADAYFYKVPHLGTWDGAFQYAFNNLYAYLSRRLSNWGYASSRFFVSPFSWTDAGPSSDWERARPPDYVATQLEAFRKWGMGREFANYAYAPLQSFDYGPYTSAMQTASSPSVVDAEPPTLAIDDPPTRPTRANSVAVAGTAHDNLAIRDVRWTNYRGGRGMASLTWQVLSGDYGVGYTWRTRWSIPALALGSGTNRITVTATDIKGLETSRTFSLEAPSPKPSAAHRTTETGSGAVPSDRTRPRLALSRRRVRLTRGRNLRLRLRCGSLEPEPCAGVLSLQTVTRNRKAGRRRRARLAMARFRVQPGRTAWIRLRLSRSAAHALRRSGSLKPVAIARARDRAGNVTQESVRFTLLPPRHAG